jgi:hypothetical protein
VQGRCFVKVKIKEVGKVDVVETRIKRQGEKTLLEVELSGKPDKAWWARLNEARRKGNHKGVNNPRLKGKLLKVPRVGKDPLGEAEYADLVERIKRDWIEQANTETA